MSASTFSASSRACISTTIWRPPFTPEHKPHIERSFGTFCRDLVPLVPGFVGHSVGQRKEIEARKSFAERLMKGSGEPIHLRLSPDDLQAFCDQWVANTYEHHAHAGLGGRTPFDVASAWAEPVRRIQDERALDVLLAPAADGNVRTITKKGLRLENALFDAPELGGLEGQEVRVLLDDADVGGVFVFNLDGAFICRAACPERGGISRRELAVARKAAQRRIIGDQMKAAKKAARDLDLTQIAQDIRRADAIAAGKLVTFPVAGADYTTPALDEAGRAARAGEAIPVPAEIEARRDDAQAAIAAELQAPTPVIPLPSPETLFARAVELERQFAAGEGVSDTDRTWLARYQRTPAYRARKSMLADFGEAILA